MAEEQDHEEVVKTKTGQTFEKRRNVAAPWKNINEFRQIYKLIFGDEATIESQQHALRKIHVWSLRRRNFCPAGVLATAVILRAQLQDSSGSENLQTLYSSAFTRFFNFMSSIMQTHSMRTMYETAYNLGLHSFVVDLRHICAHGQELPPLDELRSTAKYCLSWLHDFYWREHLQSVCDVNATQLKHKDRSQFNQSANMLLEIYDNALKCYMKGARSLTDCKRLIRAPCFAQLKKFYTSQNMKELSQMFSGVIKELSSLIKREVANKEMFDIFIQSVLQMKYFFSMAHTYSSGEPLEMIINITQGFFRMLAQHDLMEDFFYTLLQIAENASNVDAQRQSASFWAKQISNSFVVLRKVKRMYREELDKNPECNQLDFSKLNAENLPKTLRLLLVHACVNQNLTLIFGDAPRRARAWVFEREFLNQRMKAINAFSAEVVKNLLPLIEPALHESELKDLYKVFDIYLKTYGQLEETKKSTITKDSCIYTVEDLFAKFKNQTDCQALIASPEDDKKFGVWSVASETGLDSWTACPLGILPWE